MSTPVKDLNTLDRDDLSTLNSIRDKFGIKADRFDKGLKFAEQVLSGESKNRSYANAFAVDVTKAATLSNQLHRTKWVQALILFLRPDEQSLYFGEVQDIIKQGMKIVNDPRSSNRDVIEATKALQPFIKAQKLQVEMEHTVLDSAVKNASLNIDDKIALLTRNNKMINELGDVIDVVLID